MVIKLGKSFYEKTIESAKKRRNTKLRKVVTSNNDALKHCPTIKDITSIQSDNKSIQQIRSYRQEAISRQMSTKLNWVGVMTQVKRVLLITKGVDMQRSTQGAPQMPGL